MSTSPGLMPPGSLPRATPVRPPPVRPPLVRPAQGRLIGGVAAGVANHLRVPVRAVRIGFAVSGLTGAGIILYGWLWALVPEFRDPRFPTGPPPNGAEAGARTGSAAGWPPGFGPADPSTSAGSRGAPGFGAGPGFGDGLGAGVGSGTGAGVGGRTGWTGAGSSPSRSEIEDDEGNATRSRIRVDLLAGAFLVAAGAVLFGSRQGWAVKPGLLLPLLIVLAGAVIAYAQFDEVDRARWFGRTGVGTRAAALRLGIGVLLVVLGALLLVVQQTDVLLLGRTLLAAIAVLVGVGVVLAPWGVRLWRDLDAERAGRAREAERADIAAHLHDSVLQTLALIQRRSHDGAEVVRLARAQERDLRGWLYGAADADPTTMAARVTALAADAEDVHGAVVEVVTVGDRAVDERTAALLAALREAVVNAARHAEGPIQVYVEAGPDSVEAFVRDRGPGFDLAAVPADRLGVRESILGRMERHGGSGRVRTSPGEGTEVRLLLPCRPGTGTGTGTGTTSNVGGTGSEEEL